MSVLKRPHMSGMYLGTDQEMCSTFDYFGRVHTGLCNCLKRSPTDVRERWQSVCNSVTGATGWHRRSPRRGFGMHQHGGVPRAGKSG